MNHLSRAAAEAVAASLLLAFAFTASVQARPQSWVTRTPMPTPRGALTADVLGSKIHVIGGDTTYGGCHSCSSQAHDVYDPVTDSWSSAAAVPDANTWGAESTVLDGKLYLLGGWPFGGSHRVYDPVTDSWAYLPAPGTFSFGHTAAAAGGQVFVIGQTVRSYDPLTAVWTTRAPLPLGWGGEVVASVIGDTIYAFDSFSNAFYSFDLVANAWTTLASPTGTYWPSMVALGGRLLLFSGWDALGGILTPRVQEYDPVTDTWGPLPDLGVPRYESAAAAFGGSAFVFGGFDFNGNAIVPGPSEEWQSGIVTTEVRYPTAPGYEGVDAVNPDQGLPGQPFEFRVEYNDGAGLLPEAGSPKLHLDLNADGDTLDPGEGDFVMVPLDQDTDVTDGKVYTHTALLPDPASGSYRYAVRARNANGADATGAPTGFKDGPVVQEGLYNLSIFADDLLFSDPHPLVGQPFTVTVRFENLSNQEVDGLLVEVESDDVVIHSEVVSDLAPGATGEVSFEWSAAQDGFYPLKAILDRPNAFQEWNELDNDAARPIVVGEYTLPGEIELLGLPSQVTFTAGGNLGFSGTARYLGTALPSPPPVQGGTITFRPSWTSARVTTTNSAGGFSSYFPGPTSPGTYLLTVEATDYTLTSEVEIVLDTVPPPAPKPDLALSLFVDESRPCLGDSVSLSWSVSNVGTATSPATTATLESGGTALVVEAVPVLAPGATVALASTVDAALVQGSKSYSARVDAANDVDELNEGNNFASQSTFTYPVCFDWDPDYVRVSPGPYCSIHPVGFSFLVRNDGCLTSPTTLVRFRVDDGVSNTVIEDRVLVPVGGKGGSASVGFSHLFPGPGAYTVSFELDPDGQSAECDEGDNLISRSITIVACPDVDYSVDACSILADDSDPTPGQGVVFQATIRNGGPLDGAGPVEVRFLVDGVQVGNDVMTNPILVGGTDTVFADAPWIVDLAPHTLQVVVDPDNLVSNEGSESNNTSARVMPYELIPVASGACPPSGSFFDRCSTCPLDPVTIHASVINTGLFDVTAPVELVLEDRFGGGVVFLGSTSVSNLNGPTCSTGPTSGSISIQHAFLELGVHPVALVIDPSNLIPEFREDNNELVRSLSVIDCTPRPDLFLLSQHINPEELNPDPGEVLDYVTLTVFNQGVGDATGVLADLNLDGLPLCVGLALGDIPAGSFRSVQCLNGWVVLPGPPNLRILQALVDPGNLIVESNETNNAATRSFIVGPAPDLSVAPQDVFRAAGSGPDGDTLTVMIRVRNQGAVPATGTLNLSVLGDQGQYGLVEQVPLSLPAGPSEVWLSSSWTSATREARIRVELNGISPSDFDETNNLIERQVGPGPKEGRRPRPSGL